MLLVITIEHELLVEIVYGLFVMWARETLCTISVCMESLINMSKALNCFVNLPVQMGQLVNQTNKHVRCSQCTASRTGGRLA